MTRTRAELVALDHAHLIHPLHHPTDHADPIVWARGRGAVAYDVDGREYIDGLSGLWNVNVGHGREELADAAAAQMRELAYCSSYVGVVERTGDHTGRAAGRPGGQRPRGRVLHVGRRRGERNGVQDGALLLEGVRPAGQGEGDCARPRRITG